MNNSQLFEKELKSLIDSQVTSSSVNTHHHLKSKESFLQTDFISSIKHLLANFLHTTGLSQQQSESHITQQLTSIIQNEFKSNYFYLNLLTSSQSIAGYLDSDSLTSNPVDLHLSQTTQLFNNLAINHFNLKKYTISSLYLQKALTHSAKYLEKKSEETTPSGDSKHVVSRLLNNRHYEILYNTGVSLLYSKQPVAAFECLQKLAGVFNQNARLWLRLAECCCMCYKHSLNQKDEQSSAQFVNFNATVSGNEKIFKLSEKIKCIGKSFGQGFHHKINVGSSLSRDYAGDSLKVGDFESEEKIASARLTTLEYAHMCLRNALSLLPCNDKQFVASLKSESLLKSGPATTASKLNASSLDQEASPEPEEHSSANQQSSSDNLVESELVGNKLNLNRSMSSSSSSSSSSSQQKLYSCVWPSAPINLAQLQSLRSSILIQLTYVSLTLKDFVSTIKYANCLLDTSDLLNVKCPISTGTKYASCHLIFTNKKNCNRLK
jgi:tetratricopeptide (TPR) repeat protein